MSLQLIALLDLFQNVFIETVHFFREHCQALQFFNTQKLADEVLNNITCILHTININKERRTAISIIYFDLHFEWRVVTNIDCPKCHCAFGLVNLNALTKVLGYWKGLLYPFLESLSFNYVIYFGTHKWIFIYLHLVLFCLYYEHLKLTNFQLRHFYLMKALRINSLTDNNFELN